MSEKSKASAEHRVNTLERLVAQMKARLDELEAKVKALEAKGWQKEDW